MPLEILIARWVAFVWLLFGLSHVLYPAQWAALLMPLRERETGGLLLASFNLPVGLMVILGHNVWDGGIPVIVTVAGWMTTFKSLMYLLFPRSHRLLMSTRIRPEHGFRGIGGVLIVLGAVTGYDAFFLR